MAAEHAPAFIHAQVWLIMAKEGGRWTPAEIGERVHVHSALAKNNLHAMHKFGTVRKWERSATNDRVRFGITADCKVPRGVTVRDVLGMMEGAA